MSLPVHQLEILQLASNYHSSDYNRARFGSNGSPAMYFPLSLHLPDKFSVLRARQFSSAQRQSWWPAAHQTSLEHDLMSALSSSLPQKIKTSFSHPINISYMIPHQLRAIIASHALLAPTGAPTILEIPKKFSLFHMSPQTDIIHTEQLSPSSIFQTRADLANTMKAAITSDAIRSLLPHDECRASHPPFDPMANGNPLTIGNLYLSSCPGKKVRLSGPVNSRSGICRDLLADIARIGHLGVSCIICCLDDDELKFLGAPWQEYEQCAKQIGIDVLRLPTPEGLPPATSAPHLDGYLVDLINHYSLRGQSILVHCRGGVGRAGVFACCWMIRLGLCGWFEDGECQSDSKNSSRKEAVKVIRKNDYSSTIDFVKSVVALVRRRRSMKAIETYEQVEFLVDFVEHLRNLP